jgi:hypothetical protein
VRFEISSYRILDMVAAPLLNMCPNHDDYYRITRLVLDRPRLRRQWRITYVVATSTSRSYIPAISLTTVSEKAVGPQTIEDRPRGTFLIGLRALARLVWEAVVPRRVANGGEK